MIQKFKNKRKYVSAFIILALLSATVSILWVRHNQSSVSAQGNVMESQTPSKVTSMFAFDATKASDWRQGPSNETSMAAFYNNADCFVSISQHSGTPDEADQIVKATATMQPNSSQPIQRSDVTLELSTSSGAKPYTLHQFRGAINTSSQYYPAQQFGFVLNGKGYLDINGYCVSPTDLDKTLDALKAFKFTGE